MAISWIFHDSGSWSLDDITRIATEYNAAGQIVGTRPFTQYENEVANGLVATAAAEANRQSIEVALSAELDEIQAEILGKTNQVLTADFTANPARYLKILARILRHIIRLLVRRLDGTA